MGKCMKCIIISGGYIDDVFALEWLEKNAYDLLIAADSGMNFLYRNKIMPDVIAGDFDSVGQEAYAYFVASSNMNFEQKENTVFDEADDKSVMMRPEILRLPPVKDDTDTEFVVREAIRRGATAITILGGTGNRLDHVLANVHLLGIGLSCNVAIDLVDAHNRIRMIKDELVIESEKQFGDFVSILPFAGAASGVSLQGFKYPLDNATIDSFCSLGVSNEIVDSQARIFVKSGVLLVIESKD